MRAVTTNNVNLSAFDPKTAVVIEKNVLEQKGLMMTKNGITQLAVKAKRGRAASSDNKMNAGWRRGRCPWERALFDALPASMKNAIQDASRKANKR